MEEKLNAMKLNWPETNKRLTKNVLNQNRSSSEEQKTKAWQYLTRSRQGCEIRLDVLDGTNEILRLYRHEEGNTGGNSQGSGMMSDRWHKRKGKWPETRGELTFKIKHQIMRQKTPDRTSLTALWQKSEMMFAIAMFRFRDDKWPRYQKYHMWTAEKTFLRMIHVMSINATFSSCFIVIFCCLRFDQGSFNSIIFFCDGFTAPSWRISTTRSIICMCPAPCIHTTAVGARYYAFYFDEQRSVLSIAESQRRASEGTHR